MSMAYATKRITHLRKARTMSSFPFSLKNRDEHPSRHLDDDVRNVLLPQHSIEGRHVPRDNLLILLLELVALFLEILSHGHLLRGGRKIGGLCFVGKVGNLACQHRRPANIVLTSSRGLEL